MKISSEFESAVTDYIKREVFPGAACVFLNAQESAQALYGQAAILPSPQPLKADMLWDLASVSKVVGVGAVLIEKIFAGQLDIDATLKTYYPAWHEDSLTLRQLLTHTSGIDPFIPGRERLNFHELVDAINHIKVTDDKRFHYTDINFILLGLMLETLEKHDLDQIFEEEVFHRLDMTETQFGPVANAVPTSLTVQPGTVHDPKAQLLGKHCGSAGLFSSLPDLTKFVQAYLSDEKYLPLLENWNPIAGDKPRSISWDLQAGGWLSHTGYTGTFILMNLRSKQAVIFLSNRVHLKDEREIWIRERDALMDLLIRTLDAHKQPHKRT